MANYHPTYYGMAVARFDKMFTSAWAGRGGGGGGGAGGGADMGGGGGDFLGKENQENLNLSPDLGRVDDAVDGVGEGRLT